MKHIYKTFVRRTLLGGTAHLCIQSIANYFNRPSTLEEVTNKLKGDEKGTISLTEVASYLESLGLEVEGFRVSSLEDLQEINIPGLMLISNEDDLADFAIFYGKYENKYMIGNPSWGLNFYTPMELDAIWENKVILEIDFQE